MFKTTKELNSRQVELLVYGGAGVGKTSLVSTIPDADESILIIDFDNGTFTLRDRNIVVAQPKTIKDSFDLFIQLQRKNQFNWIVVDALSEMSSLFLSELKTKHRDPRQAYMEMADLIKSAISMLRGLKCNKYFITHQDQIQDDAGALLYSPALEGNALKQKLPQFFDIVACYRVFKKEDSSVIRALQTSNEADQRYICKDRSRALDAYEKHDIKVIWDKIYPEFTDNKKPEPKKPETKEEKIVAEVFPEAVMQEYFDADSVPVGKAKLEIENKTFEGEVTESEFIFANGKRRPLNECPADAKFIML